MQQCRTGLLGDQVYDYDGLGFVSPIRNGLEVELPRAEACLLETGHLAAGLPGIRQS